MTDRDPLPEPAELETAREKSRRRSSLEWTRKLRNHLNPLNREDGDAALPHSD